MRKAIIIIMIVTMISLVYGEYYIGNLTDDAIFYMNFDNNILDQKGVYSVNYSGKSDTYYENFTYPSSANVVGVEFLTTPVTLTNSYDQYWNSSSAIYFSRYTENASTNYTFENILSNSYFKIAYDFQYSGAIINMYNHSASDWVNIWNLSGLKQDGCLTTQPNLTTCGNYTTFSNDFINNGVVYVNISLNNTGVNQQYIQEIAIIKNDTLLGEDPTYTTDRAGNANSAISFNDLPEYLNTTVYNANYSNFTYSLWVKRQSQNDYEYLFDTRSASTSGLTTFFLNNSNRINTGFDDALEINTSPINLNEWAHYAIVFNSTHMLQYLNGIEENVYLETDQPLEAGNILTIGSRAYSPRNALNNGSMDEFLLFNRALTQSEILILYGGYNNSLNLTFRDEDTNNLINSVTLNVFSDSYSKVYNVTGGSIFISGIPAEVITLRYNSTGYNTNNYYIDYSESSESSTNLTLYLSNASATTQTLINVYDDSYQPVDGVYIHVLQYDVTDNVYNTVAIEKTTLGGQAYVELVQQSELYKFLLYYPVDTLRYTSEETYVNSDTISFFINLIETPLQNYYNAKNINYDLLFSSDGFDYIYSDSDGRVSKGCLNVYRTRNITKDLYNTSCSSGSSGSIRIDVNPENGTTYIARAFVTYEGTDYFLTEQSYRYLGTDPFNTNGNNWGLLLLFVLTLVVGFLGIINLALAALLIPIPLLLLSLFGIIPIPLWIPISFQILGFIVALIVWRHS